MDELTINDLNCWNHCNHHKLVGRIPDIDECDIMDHTPTEDDKKLIRQMGCCRHSLALQVLAQPVVQELGRRVRLLEDFVKRCPEYKEGEYRIVGYNGAINLLKAANDG